MPYRLRYPRFAKKNKIFFAQVWRNLRASYAMPVKEYSLRPHTLVAQKKICTGMAQFAP
jgi:hypothetical protein